MPFREIIEIALFIFAVLGAHFGSLLWFHRELKARMDEKNAALSRRIGKLSDELQVVSAKMSDLLFLMAGSQKELEDIEQALETYHGKLKPVGTRVHQRQRAAGVEEPLAVSE